MKLHIFFFFNKKETPNEIIKEPQINSQNVVGLFSKGSETFIPYRAPMIEGIVSIIDIDVNTFIKLFNRFEIIELNKSPICSSNLLYCLIIVYHPLVYE